MTNQTPKNIGGELLAFLKRNGLKTILLHFVELYGGWLIRDLPGPEGIFLRSLLYHLLSKSCGSRLLIYPKSYLIFSHRISFGERVAINVGTYLDGRGGITIGNHVMIGPGCILSSCEHGFNNPHIPMDEQPITYAPINIEDNVWIGANVCIKSGITIHTGSIIGAGSVVTHDVPAHSIMGGIPARLIRVLSTAHATQTTPDPPILPDTPLESPNRHADPLQPQ